VSVYDQVLAGQFDEVGERQEMYKVSVEDGSRAASRPHTTT